MVIGMGELAYNDRARYTQLDVSQDQRQEEMNRYARVVFRVMSEVFDHALTDC